VSVYKYSLPVDTHTAPAPRGGGRLHTLEERGVFCTLEEEAFFSVSCAGFNTIEIFFCVFQSRCHLTLYISQVFFLKLRAMMMMMMMMMMMLLCSI
jgi:hypothetical protein